MSLLSDDDKALLVLEHLGPAALAGDTMSLYDCFHLALDVAEKAILAKLAGAELPEPAMRTHGAIDTTEKLWFTADQLRQAYAQGAAAQLSDEPRLYAYTVNKVHNEFCEFEPPDDAYDEGTLIELYTRRQAND